MDASQKLSMFLDEVNQNIDLRIQENQSAAQAEAEKLLQESEEASVSRAELRLEQAKSEIAAKFQKRISQTGFRCKTALLQRREALVQNLFTESRQKLIAFAASADYEAWLEKLLITHHPEENATVFLRECDMAYHSQLAALCKEKCNFVVDPTIHIGGLSILSADGRVCENHTLDEAYLLKTRNFYRNHKLDGGAEK